MNEDQGHQDHGKDGNGGSYTINEHGERVLVERTKSLAEITLEREQAEASAPRPSEATDDEQV